MFQRLCGCLKCFSFGHAQWNGEDAGDAIATNDGRQGERHFANPIDAGARLDTVNTTFSIATFSTGEPIPQQDEKSSSPSIRFFSSENQDATKARTWGTRTELV